MSKKKKNKQEKKKNNKVLKASSTEKEITKKKKKDQLEEKRTRIKPSDSFEQSEQDKKVEENSLFEMFMKIQNGMEKLKSVPLLCGDTLLYPSEIHALDTIAQLEPVNLTKIAQTLSITKTGASKNVQKLIEKGLVLKDTQQTRREVLFTLTEAGKKAAVAVDPAKKKMFEPLERLLEKENTPEVKQFLRQMQAAVYAQIQTYRECKINSVS